jgi:hypothetical protein
VTGTGEGVLRSAPAVGSKRKVGRPKTSAKCAKCSKNWKGAFCATCPGWSAAAEAAEAAQADEAAAVATTGAAAAMTTVATSSATTGSASDLAPSAPGSTPRRAHARPRAQCRSPSRVTLMAPSGCGLTAPLAPVCPQHVVAHSHARAALSDHWQRVRPRSFRTWLHAQASSRTAARAML